MIRVDADHPAACPLRTLLASRGDAGRKLELRVGDRLTVQVQEPYGRRQQWRLGLAGRGLAGLEPEKVGGIPGWFPPLVAFPLRADGPGIARVRLTLHADANGPVVDSFELDVRIRRAPASPYRQRRRAAASG